MNRTVALYALAWIVVPVAFAVYVSFAYTWSLGRGTLPFLGTHELRWWIGFLLALFIGGACVTMARRRTGVWQLVWPALYIVAMAAVLLGTHLAVACGHGDCF
jgi:type II secretory pathway component PulF